ncbi:bZIP transcription factor-like protein [Clathrospora elynae]|uniref:BZIP transcription factor-like protein n=1 Tax=Clathrospora elynae TaxID=706981 RepID=A0A6A5SJK1_9PLEO|nr:bZIP transcription factor-like protein [Clathrospora elynae]
MSAYQGHRGPNVSQYIASLNQLSPPQQDLLADPVPAEDFSAFLNTDFDDVNNGSVEFTSPAAFDADLDIEQTQPLQTNGRLLRNPSIASADPMMEFNMNGDFQFTDFSNFGANPILDPSMPLAQPQPNHFPLAPTYASPASEIAAFTQGYDHESKKRKFDDVASVIDQSLDENARNAAEEDKRRRNTAASARFRVKKKQREQALEKSAKDMLDKVTRLESKVQQLETENAWLKGLITEKSGGKRSIEEVKARLIEREGAKSGRSSSAHTDGVGTKA